MKKIFVYNYTIFDQQSTHHTHIEYFRVDCCITLTVFHFIYSQYDTIIRVEHYLGNEF